MTARTFCRLAAPRQWCFGARRAGRCHRKTVRRAGHRHRRGPHRCRRPCALGQAAHFDLEKSFEPGKIRDALNHLSAPRARWWCWRPGVGGQLNSMPASRPPRRHYLYRILNRRSPPALAGSAKSGISARRWTPQAMHKGGAGIGRAITISPPSAPPNAKPPHQSRHWIGWMSVRDGDEIHIRASAQVFSCITRFAPSPAH